MFYDIHHYIIWYFNLYILVASIPEESWSGQPKYSFEDTTLYHHVNSRQLIRTYINYHVLYRKKNPYIKAVYDATDRIVSRIM